MSVINTANNGQRIQCSKKLKSVLGGDNVKEIQFRRIGKMFIMGANLDPNDRHYRFSAKATQTIYSSAIVNALTETLGLDFSEINPNTNSKITSITLTNIKVRKATNADGEVVKVVVIRRNKE
jgi:hypothetical protein